MTILENSVAVMLVTTKILGVVFVNSARPADTLTQHSWLGLCAKHALQESPQRAGKLVLLLALNVLPESMPIMKRQGSANSAPSEWSM